MRGIPTRRGQSRRRSPQERQIPAQYFSSNSEVFRLGFQKIFPNFFPGLIKFYKNFCTHFHRQQSATRGGVPTPPSVRGTLPPAISKPGGRDPYPPLHDQEGYLPPLFCIGKGTYSPASSDGTPIFEQIRNLKPGGVPTPPMPWGVATPPHSGGGSPAPDPARQHGRGG